MKRLLWLIGLAVVLGAAVSTPFIQTAPDVADSPLYKATLEEAVVGLKASELVTDRPQLLGESVAHAQTSAMFPERGTDILATTGFFDVFFGPGCSQSQFQGRVQLMGPTTVMRSAPNLGMIDTEILMMDLTGHTPLGHMLLRESPTQQSLGMITSQNAPMNTFPADSFFDVFFEVELTSLSLHSVNPLRVGATINDIPPFGTRYQGGPCIDLFDKNNVPRASVANVEHVVDPPRVTSLPYKVTVCRTEVTKCGPFTHCEPADPDFQCPRPTQWPSDVPTRCPRPAQATVCPIKQTKCPVADTVCPANRVPTMCPRVKTQCPVVDTACPKRLTECPPNVPTRHPVVATQCPRKTTECPQIDTRCPVVSTSCPAKPTSCQNVPTACPIVATQCPRKLTKCPAINTRCPIVGTQCPAKLTRCVAVPTMCPATPTQCRQQPTQCVNVPTICPKTATVCPKFTTCPPHVPPANGCDEVVINELMWDGTDLGGDDEYIELRNLCANDVSITGWQIKKNNVPMVTLNGVILAGGYFVVSNFAEAATRIDSAPVPDQVDTAVDLDNANVQYQLVDAGGFLRDKADDGGGPTCAGVGAPNYYSMERNDPPGDGSMCVNWHTATKCVNFDAVFCPGVAATGFCLGGPNNGLACTTNAQCGAGSTCQGAGLQGLGTPGNANTP